MIKHRFYLRKKRTNRDDKCPLYFLLFTTPQTWVATGIFILQDDWIQKKQLLLPYSDTFHANSIKLNSLKTKADGYFQQLEQEERRFSREDFVKAVTKGENSNVFNPLLTDLITEYLDVNQLSAGREKHYHVFKREMQHLQPGLRVKDVDYLFALRYEKYCLKKGNSKNTWATKMRRLKAVIHFAQRKKIIKEDPLKEYRILSVRSSRTVLTKSEFLQLQEITRTRQGLPGRLLPALDCFIFCCYTGLRYGDLKTLKITDIQNGYIRIDMHKTGLPVSIPVIAPAMELLYVQPDGHCFKVLCNEPFNRYLKEIATLTGIGKKLSTRVARHTFATLSISIGIPLKVISEMLGHTTIRTTEIYLSIYDEMKSEQMNKWQLLTA